MPSYLIVGGVLFTPLTCGLLDVAVESLSEETWQAGRQPKEHDDEQVVTIIGILAHKINHGYDIRRLPHCVEVNGVKVGGVGLSLGLSRGRVRVFTPSPLDLHPDTRRSATSGT